jgi:outer membrane biosynthesis protein TonB
MKPWLSLAVIVVAGVLLAYGDAGHWQTMWPQADNKATAPPPPEPEPEPNLPPVVVVPIPVPKPIPVPLPLPPPSSQPAPKSKKPKSKPPFTVSGEQCSQFRLGVSWLGLAGVIREAKARGYTEAQVHAMARACGVA